MSPCPGHHDSADAALLRLQAADAILRRARADLRAGRENLVTARRLAFVAPTIPGARALPMSASVVRPQRVHVEA